MVLLTLNVKLTFKKYDTTTESIMTFRILPCDFLDKFSYDILSNQGSWGYT